MEAKGKNRPCKQPIDERVLNSISKICTESEETDMLALLESIRQTLEIAPISNEYHAIVPGVITGTYRNLGGILSSEQIEKAIVRGARIQEGWCGMGEACGAALGVGVAFEAILKAENPQCPPKSSTMLITQEILPTVARCEEDCDCYKESKLCLQNAANLSEKLLKLELQANHFQP